MFTNVQLPGLGVGAGKGAHPPYPVVHVTVHLYSSRTLFANSVGIQKHFMGAEIPGIGLPNRSLVNYVMFLQRWYCKLIYKKVK